MSDDIIELEPGDDLGEKKSFWDHLNDLRKVIVRSAIAIGLALVVCLLLVSKLVDQFYMSGRSIVLPKFRGKRGHPVIFAARLYDELLAAPEEQGARAVVWAHAEEVLEVPTDEEGVVLNLNDPEALRRALGNS